MEGNQNLLTFSKRSFVINGIFVVLPGGEKDRRRRLRGDLRGAGPHHSRASGLEGGVGAPAQAGAQDGGGRSQEAAGEGARLSVSLQQENFRIIFINIDVVFVGLLDAVGTIGSTTW